MFRNYDTEWENNVGHDQNTLTFRPEQMLIPGINRFSQLHCFYDHILFFYFLFMRSLPLFLSRTDEIMGNYWGENWGWEMTKATIKLGNCLDRNAPPSRVSITVKFTVIWPHSKCLSADIPQRYNTLQRLSAVWKLSVWKMFVMCMFKVQN